VLRVRLDRRGGIGRVEEIVSAKLEAFGLLVGARAERGHFAAPSPRELQRQVTQSANANLSRDDSRMSSAAAADDLRPASGDAQYDSHSVACVDVVPHERRVHGAASAHQRRSELARDRGRQLQRELISSTPIRRPFSGRYLEYELLVHLHVVSEASMQQQQVPCNLLSSLRVDPVPAERGRTFFAEVVLARDAIIALKAR
jgi:hypothetical protein